MSRERDSYKTIEIKRKDLIVRLNDKTQDNWIKACERLEIDIRTDFGRGSHVVAYKDDCPPENSECCIMTMKRKPHNQIQKDSFKKLLHYGIESGKYTEEDMWKAFKIKA